MNSLTLWHSKLPETVNKIMVETNRYLISLLILSTISLVILSVQLERANKRIAELNKTVAKKEKQLKAAKTEIQQLEQEITEMRFAQGGSVRNTGGSEVSGTVQFSIAGWTIIAIIGLAACCMYICIRALCKQEETARASQPETGIVVKRSRQITYRGNYMY